MSEIGLRDAMGTGGLKVSPHDGIGLRDAMGDLEGLGADVKTKHVEQSEPPVPKANLTEKQVQGWLEEIEAAKKREKDWRLEAAKFISLYEGYKREESPFNILYSNTDTLLPALYNNTPRPSVGRRFKDKDPLGGAVAVTLNRTLIFGMDSNSGAEENFDDLAGHAILQALIPGRGVVRWKYEADLEKVSYTPVTEKMPDTTAEGYAAQDLPEPQVMEVAKNERLCGEAVHFDRFLHGYARKWKQVPWVSFEHHMTKEELKENFGDEIGDKVTVAKLEEDSNEVKDAEKDTRKVAVVYEIWDKAQKQVLFVSPGLKEQELKQAADPLNVSGFFPCEEPLHFLGKISSLVPQPVYELYRTQAEELNVITRRIAAVMNALKVRGAYAGELSELAEILKQDDGGMVAVDNTQILGDGKGLKDALFFMPLAELVSVLQQLYLQRTQIKTVIYEITGISDILRGSSVASETATAQTIKNQWGTLRLKSMQKKVANWCKGNLRIMAEIAARKFSQDTFQRMTGLPYITAEQKQQAQMMMQQFQQQAHMQPPPQPGQPPAPPPQPPQQAVDALATPVWEDIIALMRDTVGMEFRVDIETNSTIADDMAEDQKNVGELLNALSQFLNGVAPLIENGSMPFEVAKTMMLGLVRKMAMGPEVEEQLDKMKPPTPPQAEKAPPPPPVDPNIQLKQQAEAASIQLQMAQTKLDMQMAQQEMQFKEKEMAMKLRELDQKQQVADAKFAQAMALAKQKASAPSPTPQGA